MKKNSAGDTENLAGKPAKDAVSIPVKTVNRSKHQRQRKSVGQHPPSPSWKLVSHQRQRKRKQPVVGSDECDDIKSTNIRPLKLFVTRCDTGTTADNMKTFMEDKRKWPVMSVEPIKTKFNTYSSWKVVLDRNQVQKSEVLTAANWPKGVMVRPYIMKRNVNAGKFSSGDVPQIKSL